MSTAYGYGLWPLVVFNSLLFIAFAASFFHPNSRSDWRALGGFSAFVVALFTEMYGYPLTKTLAALVPGLRNAARARTGTCRAHTRRQDVLLLRRGCRNQLLEEVR